MTGRGSGPFEARFLDMLEAEDRAGLLGLGRARSFPRGATIAMEGDHRDTVFLLLDGWVKVTRSTPDGREILLAVDGPGELLGEFEALDPDISSRAAGVMAMEPVECREIPGDEFRSLIESHPRIPLVLIRWLIRRLQAADRRRVGAASLDTAHRLAEVLLELAESTQPGHSQVDIEIPLTQEELASLIAASRDAVVRALTTLRSRQLIATARYRITILDIDGLRRYAA